MALDAARAAGETGHVSDHNTIHAAVNRIPADGSNVVTETTGDAAYEALVSRTGATAGEVPTLQADNTLAFAAAAASVGGESAHVATNESTTGTSFTDLATAGPAVTVTVGTSGKALVIVAARLYNSTSGAYAMMSYAVTGANTAAAADALAVYNQSAAANNQQSQAWAYMVTGLAAGSTTFTAKYRATAGTASFVDRRITVITL